MTEKGYKIVQSGVTNPRPRPQIKTGAMEGYKRKGGVKVEKLTFNQVSIAISAIAAVALKLLGKTDDSIWFLCVLIFFCLTEERIEKKKGRD